MEDCIHDFKFIRAVILVGQKGCQEGGGIWWLGSNFKIIDYMEKHSEKLNNNC